MFARSIIRLFLLAGCLAPFSLIRAEEILLTIPQPPPGNYSQYFGRSVANVGDHHGDGHDDYIVGMPGYSASGGSTVGRMYFFSGGPGLFSEPQWISIGSGWDNRMGWSVTGLGDFNADGQPDYASSHPGAETPGVRVFYGGPDQDGNWDLELTNAEPYSWFGGTISGGHDLNGDGHPDLAVAANLDATGISDRGRIYVYFGGPEVDFYVDAILDAPIAGSGFGITLQLCPDVTGDGEADMLVVNLDPFQLLIYAGGPEFDGAPDFSLDLQGQVSLSGYTDPERVFPQTAAGDLTGDGQPEIAVSMPGLLGGGDVWILEAGTLLDNQVDAVLQAREQGEYFGRMLDISGDFDGDGVLDLLVGSVGAGEAYLDGFLYVYSGTDLTDLRPSLVMTDLQGNRRFGAAAVSLGDFEGDGDDELLVGSASPYGYVWIVDEFFFDCDDNDVPDWDEGAEDCDADGVPDSCQSQWSGVDCNGNQVVDACELDQDPDLDCDGNGVLDSCELSGPVYPDPDCDDDGVLDACQLAEDPDLDCDGDGQLDTCQIAQWPQLDCNGDGLIDDCQWASDPSQDCDENGVYDGCQIAENHLLDSDQDGVLDHCQFPGRLSLYSDPNYTSHELVTDQLGLVGPFYLVLNVPEGTADVTHVELELVIPPELFGIQVDLNPEMGFDADPRTAGLSLFFPGLTPDTNGNLEVARIWPIVAQPGISGVTIDIQGNFSVSGSEDFDRPIYTDYHGEDRLITETERGFLNAAISDVPPAGTMYSIAVTNHPNPFNPRTTIQMMFPRAGSARLEILDLGGRAIRHFDLQVEGPGPRPVTWQGRDNQGRQVSSGVYFARVTQGGRQAQTKLILLR